MFDEICIGFTLLAVCVVIHAAGLALLLARLARPRDPKKPGGFARTVWRLVGIAWGLVALHLIQISVWAFFYSWAGCLPDIETALYFSGATYSTVGYGDVVLPHAWRMLGSIEGLTGILMCGLSTGFFFVVVSRLADRMLSGRQPAGSGSPPGPRP